MSDASGADDGAERRADGPRRSRGRAIGLRTLAVVLAIVALGVGTASRDADDFGLQMVLGFLGVGALLGSVALWNRGKRHTAPLADEVLESDPRPPVLYLRSFDDDAGISNQEDALAEVVEEVGPFIAIGRPGEALPRVGAAKKYVSDAEWRPYVAGMLDRARFVIVLAGRTEGLGWEIEQCFRRLDPAQLVVLVPDDAEGYDTFRARAEAHGMRLPPYPGKRDAKHRVGGVAGLVHFGPGWSGRFQGFERAAFRGMSTELAGSGNRRDPRLRLALQPVYEGLGLDLAPPRRNWVFIGCLGYFALVLVFLAVMIWLGVTGRLD